MTSPNAMTIAERLESNAKQLAELTQHLKVLSERQQFMSKRIERLEHELGLDQREAAAGSDFEIKRYDEKQATPAEQYEKARIIGHGPGTIVFTER